MATTLEKLQVELELNRDQFTAELQEVQKELVKLNDGTSKLSSGLFASMTKANVVAQLATKALGMVLGVVKKIGVALLGLGKRLLESGSQLSRLRIATNTLATNTGLTVKQMDNLRKSLADSNTYGIKAEQVLSKLVRTGLFPMAEALETVDARSGKTAKGVNALILTMKDLGASAGISSADAIERLTEFINRGNVQMVDNMVAVGNLGAEYRMFAKELGKNRTELTALEEAQARMNIVMREGKKALGAYANTYATSGKMLSSVKDATSSLFEELGASLEPLWASISTGVLNFVSSIRDFLIENGEAIRQWAIKVGAWVMWLWRLLGSVLQRLPVLGSYFKSLSEISLKGATAFQGSTDGANATAGALDNMAGSAKDAKKELLGLQGFDEMNVLQEKEDTSGAGGGGGAGGGAGLLGGEGIGDVLGDAKDKMDAYILEIGKKWDAFKKKLATLFEPFMLVWDNVVKPAWENLKEGLRTIGEELGFVGEQGSFLEFVIKVIVTAFGLLVGTALVILNGIVMAIIGVIRVAKMWFLNMAGGIAIIINFFRDLDKGVGVAFSNMIDSAWELWYDTMEIFGLSREEIEEFGQKVKDTLSNIGQWFKDRFSDLKNWLKRVWDDISGFMQGSFNKAQVYIINKINAIKNTFLWLKDTAIAGFYYLRDRAVSLVSNLVTRVKDKLNGLKSGFINLATSIVNTVKAPLNNIIDKINYFIGKARSIDIAGFTPFSGLPYMPRLATGGIVDAPTTALIGESGREAVLPLDRNTGWMDELASKISGRGGGQPIHLTVQVGDEKIAEQVIDYLNDKAFRSQSNLAKI